jgi:hypothetical protein
MPSGLPVLPNLNGFSVKKKPIFATGMFEFMPGKELQVAQQAFPLWEFELTYEVLRTTTNNQIQDGYFDQYSTQYESMLVVFLQSLGQANDFLFNDLSDNSRTGQFIATGDGVTHVFRLVRDWGSGSLSMNEPIGELNQNLPFQFYLNGTPAGPGVLPNGESIDFGSSPPAAGVTITGDFSFYYKCRFIEDTTQFEEFLYDRWANKSLKFRSVKTTPQIIQAPLVAPVNGWSIERLEMPAGYSIGADSFSWGCLAKLNNFLVATLYSQTSNQGFFWQLINGGGIPLMTQPPYGSVPWKRFLCSEWWTRASDYGGDQWVGSKVASDTGLHQPVAWSTDEQVYMGANLIFPVQPGADLYGVDKFGNNAVGSTDDSGVIRAVWFTVENGALLHTVNQLASGKNSLAIAIVNNGSSMYGWDTDSSNLQQAVTWDKGSGTETTLDVPGGNLASAAYCADDGGTYSGGTVITGDGHVHAIYWTGTGTHTLLPNLGSDFFGSCTGICDGGAGLVKCGITGNASGKQRAAAWLSDVPTELPMLFGCDPTIDVTNAWAINADGNLIAGTCTLGGSTWPVLWRLA